MILDLADRSSATVYRSDCLVQVRWVMKRERGNELRTEGGTFHVGWKQTGRNVLALAYRLDRQGD